MSSKPQNSDFLVDKWRIADYNYHKHGELGCHVFQQMKYKRCAVLAITPLDYLPHPRLEISQSADADTPMTDTPQQFG